MEEHTYRIVFHGRIGHGQEPAIVKERLSEMFKLESARIEQLFCGSPIVVKKKLSIELAHKYKQRFEQSGALCDIEREGDIEIKMENQDLSELPAKAHVNMETPSSGSTQAKTLSLCRFFADLSFAMTPIMRPAETAIRRTPRTGR